MNRLHELKQRIEAREARQHALTGADQESHILFGDLHVHTTFSPDAFIMSVPLMGGSGQHPPADACDFARYCAALDFWSINDHAELLTARQWAETRELFPYGRWRIGEAEEHRREHVARDGKVYPFRVLRAVYESRES